MFAWIRTGPRIEALEAADKAQKAAIAEQKMRLKALENREAQIAHEKMMKMIGVE